MNVECRADVGGFYVNGGEVKLHYSSFNLKLTWLCVLYFSMHNTHSYMYVYFFSPALSLSLSLIINIIFFFLIYNLNIEPIALPFIPPLIPANDAAALALAALAIPGSLFAAEASTPASSAMTFNASSSCFVSGAFGKKIVYTKQVASKPTTKTTTNRRKRSGQQKDAIYNIYFNLTTRFFRFHCWRKWTTKCFINRYITI